MTTEQPIPSAQDLGLMQGFPPPPERRVGHAQQLYGPYNRWSFQHELQLNRTADVWRGPGPVAALPEHPRPIEHLPYHNHAGQRCTFGQMVERSSTDAIVVLHQGALIYERYLNGMRPHTLHAWASCSKSMTGTLAALLAHAGLIDPGASVASYLPELAESGFADATLGQVMDMTSAVRFADDDADPVSESGAYAVALGWRAPPPDYHGPADTYALLSTMCKAGQHGQRFVYLTPNTDVLAWVLKRVLGQTLAEATRERIWSRLGAERDAFWILDPACAETAGSGLVTTARDMARFGQMLLQEGWFNGQQILPPALVREIAGGGAPAAFARGPAADPGNQGYSYRHQWWNTHNPHGAYLALGYGGQILYIDPTAQMVVAKLSSYPTPTPAGNEFYAALAALPALGQALAG